MPKNAKSIRSDLRKAEAHRIRPEEYDDAPELTPQQLARAVIEIGGKAVRGRPRLDHPKTALKLRIDADIVSHFRKTGPGWQTRINDTLRKATRLKAAR